MKIYINNTLVKTEILPNNTPTLDETLETFSFALMSNTNSLPYAPMQSVKVDFLGDGNDLAYFYIISDNVETFSLNPIRYKHNISCIQNTRELSKHLVRNSVFSQPANPKVESYHSLMGYYAFESNHFSPYYSNYWAYVSNVSQPLSISNREKIKSLKVRIELKVAILNYDDSTVEWRTNVKKFSELTFQAGKTATLTNTLYIRYTDSNNATQITTLVPSDLGLTEFEFNQGFDCDKIKNLIDNGATNIELLFGDPNVAPINQSMPIICNNMTKDSTLDGCVVNYIMTLKIIAETYYYTVYDILDLLIKRQKKETSINSLTPLFSLPQSGDLYNLLQNTIAPNFIFTQLTMYECVAEVFQLFDAIFNMDENGVLGIEYFNDQSNEIITPKFSGRVSSLGEDRYINGFVSHYQDARIEETFPNKNNYAPLRNTQLGVPQSGLTNAFIVPHKIHSIIKMTMPYSLPAYYTDSSIYTDYSKWNASNEIELDLTKYVVREDLWLSLNSQSYLDLPKQLIQLNTIYFQQNDNKIQVSGNIKDWLLGNIYSFNAMRECVISNLIGYSQVRDLNILNDTPDWKSIRLKLTYIASVDGKTKIHSLINKYEGETVVDQSNGAVDLNKLGLNILGLSLKLGNPTLNATHIISSWANRIKTGQIYEYQNGIWIANVVNYTFINGKIQGKISFVQNFNQLALRTKLLREKRLSNISSELTQKSEELITDYVYYYGSTTPVQQYEGETIHFNKTYFLPLLHASFLDNNTTYDIQCAGIVTGTIAIISNFIYIPMIRYGAGNTINFEMSFDNSLSAGNQTTAVSNAWFGSSDYYTKVVKYSDDYGFLDTVTIKAGETIIYTRSFPEGTMESDSLGLGYFQIKNYKVYKQPNEIFALNYQLAFLPVDANKDFLGNEFINNNAFVHSPEKGKKCYICFKAEKSSVLDTKATPYFLKKEINSITSTESNNAFRLTFTYNAITNAQIEQTISWAIVDENDNILFASNSKPSYLAVFLHFFTKLNRLS